MRAVHRYYKYHYHKLLLLRRHDEQLAPSIDKLHYCYESLTKLSKKAAINMTDYYKSQYLNYVVNYDHVELNMTKDALDFDR